MTTLQKKIDFLQNEVASKNAIIKMLVEMQTGIWDWGTSCTSQDKDNITSVNITDNSLISVNNLKHKQNYDQKKKNREQNKEKPAQKIQIKNFQMQTRMGIKQHIQIGILRKETVLFIGNLNNNTNEEDLCKHFGLRLTQYLKQNCLVNMPLIDKTGKSKEFAFTFTPVGTVETEWNRFAW